MLVSQLIPVLFVVCQSLPLRSSHDTSSSANEDISGADVVPNSNESLEDRYPDLINDASGISGQENVLNADALNGGTSMDNLLPEFDPIHEGSNGEVVPNVEPTYWTGKGSSNRVDEEDEEEEDKDESPANSLKS